MIGGWRHVGPRDWRVPLLCGMGMVILQTGLAIYRFGETTSLREWGESSDVGRVGSRHGRAHWPRD